MQFADASEASRHNLAELAGHTTATQDSYYTPGRTSNQRCQAMLEVADKVTGGQEEVCLAAQAIMFLLHKLVHSYVQNMKKS